MAKNKKSKILAMALCASVMAGLYANPVFAGPVEINYDAGKGGIHFSFANESEFEGDGLHSYVWTPVDGVLQPSTDDVASISGEYTITSESIAQALNGQIIENLTINNLNGYDIANVGGITRTEGAITPGTGITSIENFLNVDGNTQEFYNAAATFKVDRNGHITAGNLKANGSTGGWYVEDIDLGNGQYKTMIYAASKNGTSTLRIDPENGNTSTKGTIGVGKNLDQPYTQINGAHDANVGDIALGIQYDGAGKATGQNILLDASEGHITAKGSVYAADFNGVSIEKDGDNTLINGVDINGAAGDISDLEHLTQNINAEETKPGETVFNGIVSADEIKTNNNRFWVDDEGNMSLTNGTAGVNTGTNLVEINTVNNTVVTNNDGTTFTNKEDGSTTVIRGDNITSGAVNADTLNGKNINEIFKNIEDSTGDISDLQKKTQNMWADENQTNFSKSLNVNGSVNVGDGAVQLKGHWGQEASVELRDADGGIHSLTATQLGNINNVIKEDGNVVGTTVKTTSGADLDAVAKNTQHITHDEQGTHIEGMTIQQGDPGANISGIYTINGASFEATNQNGGIKISGVTLEQGGINAYAPSNVGGVSFDGSGSMNSVNNINGVNFDELAQTVEGSSADVQHIKHYDDYAINGQRYDATVIEESVAITKDRGVDVIGGNGASVATITRQGNARFGAETGANVRIQDGGVYVNENYQNTVASLTAEGLTLGEQTLTEQKISDIGGITRTGAPEYGYTTNIEGSFRVKSDGSFGTDNDSFVVNDLGEVSAANGEFFVNQNGAVTAQADSVIGDVRFSGGGDLNNVNHINGAAVQGWGEGGLEISGVAMENGAIKVTGINGAAVNAYGEGGLEISGVGMLNGNVSAQTFNGVSIEQNEEGSAVVGGIDLDNLNENLTGVTENVAGISRDDGKTTNIEGRVFVSKDEFYIGGYGDGSNWIRHDETGTTFGGKVTFNNGYNASFWYGDKQTTLGDLAYNLDDLTEQVQDIYDRTQGINRDENGNTVISNDNRTWENGQSIVTDNGGATVTVGEDVTVAGGDLNVANGDLNVGYTEGSGTGGTGSSATGEGGNGNFAGDVNVGGSITVGDASDGVYTQVGESGLTAVNGNDTNNISSEGMTVTGDAGVNNISDAGMTITGTDGSVNNISSAGMTVGTTNIAKDSVSADKGTFGEGTFGSGEDQTVINNDGVTVGDKNDGTSIKHDEISVGDGGYIGGGDVVSGEGVSLNQTAERVGRLENKVGKLEDRIDKVGAMAAAIANLRTMGYDPAAPTEVAVGIGQYRDETGAALGLFHYPNRDFMLSLSVSTSGDEVMGGIGATWKFGRKSPEKVAEIKKAQAEADARRAEEAKLAKAEEMKQAAKEAKIKAQQERHAKLAAERAAQAEAAK